MTGQHLTEDKLAKMMERAESGDGGTACRLGDIYREGEQVAQDWKAAFRWYHLGATQGDAEAQNNLGTMYQNGLSCEADSTLAAHWYRQSAEQGNATAQYNLAKRYQNGDGVELDLAEAARWFAAAGEQGELEAICDLGTMLRLGHGMPRDLVAAAALHILAAKQGDGVAMGNIADYREELQDIGLSGNAIAAKHLCEIYNLGLGVEKSMPLTWTWVRWAKECCLPPNDAEDVAEIAASYAFYKDCLDPDDRKEGDRVLKELEKSRSRNA